ncbi:related to TPR domain [Lecanosticta acicola]|uniref:Related to TPR domain n=1 Tax=Lecanosticta acicola TaxID=111012 RepID=A0AAI9EDJ2_9PEZI|nr:related to TPR domain [Lecanosticta acicola]
MAKTKTKSGQKGKEMNRTAANGQAKLRPDQLYATAVELVEQSQPEEALKFAKQLWSQVQDRAVKDALPAAILLGEISMELGATDSARGYFEKAVQLDPEGKVPEALGGGAEKFLWLAQLCEEGGKQSVEWFEKGAKALQHEIAALENGQTSDLTEEELLLMRVEKKRKLANALCGIVEVYMTDLSWEDEAEARCENLITEAMAIEDETSPEVLQTLASVRLSQQRIEDAQSALKRSLESWIELEPEDPAVPDFATKISLSRLLMEAQLEGDAMEVLHRLIQEDDQSVEAWYLGGWCQHLVAEHNKANPDATDESAMDISASDHPSANQEQVERALKGSRRWLKQSLKLYELLDYEDDRLYDHAKELVANMDTVLGPEEDQAEGGDEWEDEWEGIDEDGIEDEEDGDEDAQMQD